jgi:hypothetical protein
VYYYEEGERGGVSEQCIQKSQLTVTPQDAGPPPLPMSAAKAGRNHLK